MFFKRTKFTVLKFIHFRFQTQNKQMRVFFQTRMGNILIWQKFSGRWESDFNASTKHEAKTILHEKCPNTEFILVRIQSEYRKIRIRNNSVFGHFSRSELLLLLKYHVFLVSDLHQELRYFSFYYQHPKMSSQ